MIEFEYCMRIFNIEIGNGIRINYLYNRLLIYVFFEIFLDLVIMIKLCSSVILYLYIFLVILYCNFENL